jgi:hypothetical protein
VNIIPVPGLKTIMEHDYARCAQLARHGYKWITFQAQNDAQIRDYDLNPARGAGLTPGVWGVSYNAATFHRDGHALGQQAVKLGAQHVTMDVEMAAKDTRPGGLKPVIDGLRAGGWAGPVNLNTMGPPANPQVNDYAIDTQSFLDTGGGILTQAYANETDTFTPELAVQYWTRVGIPRDRLNLTISLYPAESDKQYPGRRYDGAKWVELLQAAGWDDAISIFMAEAATDADLQALDAITLATSTPPPDPSPVAANRGAALRFLADSIAYWRDKHLAEETLQRQRQTLAWRLLNMPETRANQIALRDALDKAGAPRP